MTNQVKGYEADIVALQKEAKKKEMTWSDSQKQEHRKKIEYILADRELTLKKVNYLRKQLI